LGKLVRDSWGISQETFGVFRKCLLGNGFLPEFLNFLKKPDFNEEEGVFQDTNGSWKQAKIEV